MERALHQNSPLPEEWSQLVSKDPNGGVGVVTSLHSTYSDLNEESAKRHCTCGRVQIVLAKHPNGGVGMAFNLPTSVLRTGGEENRSRLRKSKTTMSAKHPNGG